MARPKKNRIVSIEPVAKNFFSEKTANQPAIVLSLDEFEVFQLLDYEGLSQEEAAFQMGISRTTVTAIYASSRHKIATFLVNGGHLFIKGEACEVAFKPHNCSLSDVMGEKGQFGKGRNKTMRIAVTYDEGMVFPHFGRSEHFKIYDVDGTTITKSEVLGTEGATHSGLVEWLTLHHVNVVMCGGIGGGAVQFLSQANIRVVPGASGSADDAVDSLIKGTFKPTADVSCHHHEEGECECSRQGKKAE